MNLIVPSSIACAWIVLGTLGPVVEASSPPGGATDLLVVATCNVEDIVVTLLGDSAEWKVGQNRVVLEFHSAPRKRLIDVGTVVLKGRLAVAGAGRMVARAHVRTDVVPGRYLGAISVPRAGKWEVAVSWQGRVGRGTGTLVVLAG
jgi:hypothetical protein